MDSFSSKHVPKAAAAAGLPDLPDVPTAAEAGFPGFEVMATDSAGAEHHARHRLFLASHLRLEREAVGKLGAWDGVVLRLGPVPVQCQRPAR